MNGRRIWPVEFTLLAHLGREDVADKLDILGLREVLVQGISRVLMGISDTLR